MLWKRLNRKQGESRDIDKFEKPLFFIGNLSKKVVELIYEHDLS